MEPEGGEKEEHPVFPEKRAELGLHRRPALLSQSLDPRVHQDGFRNKA